MIDDGRTLDIEPDTVFDVPPGHDQWVIGDEPWVAIEWGASGRALGAALHEAGSRSLATVLFTDIVDSTARLEPTRAIRIEIRVGVYTGEVELVGDDVRGIAVQTAARVVALAGPNEVLVSSTTRGLLESSGMVLEDAGAHEMIGLSGTPQLFRLVMPPTS